MELSQAVIYVGKLVRGRSFCLFNYSVHRLQRLLQVADASEFGDGLRGVLAELCRIVPRGVVECVDHGLGVLQHELNDVEAGFLVV